MIRDVVHVSPIVLPEEINLARTPPRPPEFRKPDYEQKFDYHTLIYDVFHYHGDVAAIGPPLLNLKEVAKSFEYRANGRLLRAHFSDMNRMSRWIFKDASKLHLPRWIRGRKPLSRRSPSDLLKALGARNLTQPQPFPGGELTISFSNEKSTSAALTSVLGEGKVQRHGEGDTRRKITR